MRVLKRDSSGRATLWQCLECGELATLGWGDRCNACIARAERHNELIKAIKSDNTDDFTKAFNQGLELAAKLAESWGNEADEGGGPRAGDGYRNLAGAVRKYQR